MIKIDTPYNIDINAQYYRYMHKDDASVRLQDYVYENTIWILLKCFKGIRGIYD